MRQGHQPQLETKAPPWTVTPLGPHGPKCAPHLERLGVGLPLERIRGEEVRVDLLYHCPDELACTIRQRHWLSGRGTSNDEQSFSLCVLISQLLLVYLPSCSAVAQRSRGPWGPAMRGSAAFWTLYPSLAGPLTDR